MLVSTMVTSASSSCVLSRSSIALIPSLTASSANQHGTPSVSSSRPTSCQIPSSTSKLNNFFESIFWGGTATMSLATFFLFDEILHGCAALIIVFTKPDMVGSGLVNDQQPFSFCGILLDLVNSGMWEIYSLPLTECP